MDIEFLILLRLLTAALFGSLIGYERQRHGKEAGLRTHMLVAIGAALFVDFGELFMLRFVPLVPPGEPGNFRLQIEPLTMVQSIIMGVSFLGAGNIFFSREKNRIHGLTTAASLWITAAVGIAVGLSRYWLAAGSTLIVVVILWLGHIAERRFQIVPHRQEPGEDHDPPHEGAAH